jgi:bisphosphoglycerate-dependent phosphoglycerate mutase
VFDSPPQRYGTVRTVLLKASGYYDIHLEAKGKPQLATIEKLEKEPGYAVQYAFKEYLKWREGLMKTISRRGNDD